MENAEIKPVKTRKWAWWALGIIAVLAIMGALSDDNQPTANKSAATIGTSPAPAVPSPVPEPKIPPLELQSWHWSEDYGYVTAEGQVKNISAGSMSNVQAVATFYTKDGDFITSSDAMIDYNPILPGQLSPFKVMTTHNPAMKQASVEFKKLFGGTIDHRVKEKAKK